MTRGSRGPGVVAVALAALVGASAAAAHHGSDPDAPYDFRNRDASAFGFIGMPVYLDAPAGESLELEVPVTLHPEALPSPAARYLVGFNLHAGVARLTDVAVTFNGKPVAMERDERSSALQPRVIIPGDALPRTGPVKLLLAGTATASEDGRIHVGALAIAFDAAWGTLDTRDGAAAQAYSFTLLMSEGHGSGGLAPRFHGEGNSAVVLVPLLAMLGPTLLGLRTAWRRLHPAPGKKPAATPLPAAVPVPAHMDPMPQHMPTPARSAWPVAIAVPAAPPPQAMAAKAVPVSSGVPSFRPLVADPLARRPATPRAPLPRAVIRRKRPDGSIPHVTGATLAVGRVVAMGAPLARAASGVAARPPRPSRASQAKARASPFEFFEVPRPR